MKVEIVTREDHSDFFHVKSYYSWWSEIYE